MPLFLLLIFFLTVSTSTTYRFSLTGSSHYPGINSCDFFTPVRGVEPIPLAHLDLSIVVEETVDIHLAALAFERLYCILNHTTTINGTLSIRAHHSRQSSIVHLCCGEDPYVFFKSVFMKRRIRREDLCKVHQLRSSKLLIFSRHDDLACPGHTRNSTFHLVLERRTWQERQDAAWHERFRRAQYDIDNGIYRFDAQLDYHIRNLYELSFGLADAPIDASRIYAGVNATKVPVERGYEPDKPRDAEIATARFVMMCTAVVLIGIVIIFVCLVTAVNVTEHYVFAMEARIRERVRRHRDRMRDEVEEGEEAGEERPHRRVRLNSEERSLLGTDDNTIRTALSGRFSSLNSLSFHSAESRPRRVSLNSLDEVNDETSCDVTTTDSWTATDTSKQGDAEKK